MMAPGARGVSKDGQRRQLTGIMAASVFAALLFGGGGYLWAARNGDRLDDRNLRELARISREIEGRVGNLHSVMRNLADTTAAAVASRAALIPHLGPVQVSPGGVGATDDTLPRCPIRAEIEGPPGTTVCLSRGLGALELAYRGRPHRDDARAVTVTTRWPLEAMASSLGSEYFETTLLADESDRVVLSAPDIAGIRVYELISILDSLPGGGASAESRGEGRDRPVTEIRRATIAGRPYRAFIQPIRVSLGREGERDVGPPQTWRVMGLVSMSRMTQERLSLGPGVVLTVGLLLAVVLLALPYVRTASMGPRERLRLRHLLWIIGSLILLSGGLGIGLADLAHYVQLRKSMSDEVATLADSLHARTRTEIEDAIAQLDEWTRSLAELDERFARRNDGGESGADDVADPRFRVRVPVDSAGAYPMLTMAFWVEPDSGYQVAKWTPRSTNTSLVNVREREYFRAIRERRAWTSPPSTPAGAEPDASARPYFVEGIRTWTTGEKSVAISTEVQLPTAGDSATPASPTWVGVVLTKLAALDEPVLPPGVSFAVVDSTGHALVHDLEARALEENLLEETGSLALRSTLIAHAERDLDLTYRGRRTSVFVRPLRATPLSLVVLLDRDQLEAVHFESVFEASALFVGLCALMAVWFALVEAVVPRKMHWVWPDPEHPGKYLALGLVLAVLGLALALAVLFPAQFGSRLSYLWIPFQGLGLGLVAGSIPRARDHTMRRARWLGSLLALVATAGIVVGFLRGGEDSAGTWPYPIVLLLLLVATAAAVFVLRLEYLVERRPPERRSEVIGPQKQWQSLRELVDREGLPIRVFLGSMWIGSLLVGVLPGYYLYQLGFLSNVELLARHHQAVVARSLTARRLRLDSIGRDGGLSPRYVQAMQATGYDVLFGSLPFDLCRPDPADASCPLVVGSGSSVSEGAGSLLRQARAVGDVMPFVGETSLAMRGLDAPQPDRSWLTDDDGKHVMLEWDSLRLTATLPVGNGGQGSLWWWAAMALGLTGLAWLLGWVSRRVFLVDLLVPRDEQLADIVKAIDAKRLDGNVVIVCTRSTDRSVLGKPPDGWQVIDLIDSSLEVDGLPVLALDENATVLCLDHADHRVREGDWGRALLSALERVVYLSGRRVILLTSQDPTTVLAFERRDREDDRHAERWTRLLGQFTKVTVRDGVADRELELDAGALEERLGRRAARRVVMTLQHECCRRPLHRTGMRLFHQILETDPPKAMTHAEIIGRIREEADSYYEALWAVLGDEERLALAQLASGSVLSPSLSEAIVRLHGRGILEREPELRLMNDSFERFVRDKAPEHVVREWELAGSASTWELIRPPLFLGWIVLALFLFWTQRDLLGSTVAFLTTAGVGLATLGQLATHLRAGDKAPAGGSRP